MPPFDTDGAPASFSPAEQQAIVAIWRAVAEDFAPFDVDVSDFLRVGVIVLCAVPSQMRLSLARLRAPLTAAEPRPAAGDNGSPCS